MANSAARKTSPRDCAELHSGDRMTRAEFHRVYEQTPDKFKAELIGGIVYVSSPLGLDHATGQPALTMVATAYAFRTPGVQVCDNTTIFLGEDEEPQPDLSLRVLPEYGGRSRTIKKKKKSYVSGPPEWIGEVAHSSRAIDLHLKKLSFQSNHVQEYLVMCVEERELRWFDLQADKELQPDADGVFRMRSFPGLWIHGEGLFAKDYFRLMNALEQGMDTSEYAAFVKRLAAQHAGKKKKR
jgi:Putative restriction endonuclease